MAIFARLQLAIMLLLLPSLLSLLFLPYVAEAAAAVDTEKVTQLSFYFHDILVGKNQSAAQVVAPAKGFPNEFGTIMVMDDPLTEGPSLESRRLGSAQGLYSSACAQQQQGSVRLLMALTFVFQDGDFNGSTLALLGSNAVFSDVREMPIVGGTGVFRLARGFAQARTHEFDLQTGNAVVHYNVTVVQSPLSSTV